MLEVRESALLDDRVPVQFDMGQMGTGKHMKRAHQCDRIAYFLSSLSRSTTFNFELVSSKYFCPLHDE